MKTIKLADHPHRGRASDLLTGAMLIVVLLFARAALNGSHVAALPAALPTTRPVIVLMTTTPLPTPAPIVRVQQVIVEVTAPPVYVEVPAEPAVVYVSEGAAAPPAAPPTVQPQSIDPAYSVPTSQLSPEPIDQADPRCTGAADGTISADCEGMDDALLRVAQDR